LARANAKPLDNSKNLSLDAGVDLVRRDAGMNASYAGETARNPTL
jgi:hypothetical protein